jgi:hypothetical protein
MGVWVLSDVCKNSPYPCRLDAALRFSFSFHLSSFESTKKTEASRLRSRKNPVQSDLVFDLFFGHPPKFDPVPQPFVQEIEEHLCK